jgi:hypothetical protein
MMSLEETKGKIEKQKINFFGHKELSSTNNNTRMIRLRNWLKPKVTGWKFIRIQSL